MEVPSHFPELVVKFSINNQISIGLQNVYRKPVDIYQPIGNFIEPDSYMMARYSHAQKNLSPSGGESFDERLNRLYPPLDIKIKSQRSKKTSVLRSGFTKNSVGDSVGERVPPFGVKQGQKLRESGAAVDLLVKEKGGYGRIVTLTLVGDTREAFECLAANSFYVINRLFENIRRNGEECKHWFFVWEHQKRGALHLHICLWHESRNRAAKLGAKLVSSWYRILSDLGGSTGVDMFVRRDKKTYTPRRKWQSRNEPMRKSAGGYFSKYAAKASNKQERRHIQHLARRYPPSRFWGSSRAIKNIVKENTFVYRFESHKTEVSKHYHARLEEILSQFDIAHYGSYEWKYEKELIGNKGQYQGKRTITEGFAQNFYFLPSEFERAKAAVMADLGCESHDETSALDKR